MVRAEAADVGMRVIQPAGAAVRLGVVAAVAVGGAEIHAVEPHEDVLPRVVEQRALRPAGALAGLNLVLAEQRLNDGCVVPDAPAERPQAARGEDRRDRAGAVKPDGVTVVPVAAGNANVGGAGGLLAAAVHVRVVVRTDRLRL